MMLRSEDNSGISGRCSVSLDVFGHDGPGRLILLSVIHGGTVIGSVHYAGRLGSLLVRLEAASLVAAGGRAGTCPG